MSGSANVSIGGYRKDQQMSGSANVRVESANGRLAEISKCLSQQMSKPSQQKSRQQMSVSKSPVGKWKIGVSSNTLSKRREASDVAGWGMKRTRSYIVVVFSNTLCTKFSFCFICGVSAGNPHNKISR